MRQSLEKAQTTRQKGGVDKEQAFEKIWGKSVINTTVFIGTPDLVVLTSWFQAFGGHGPRSGGACSALLA